MMKGYSARKRKKIPISAGAQIHHAQPQPSSIPHPPSPQFQPAQAPPLPPPPHPTKQVTSSVPPAPPKPVSPAASTHTLNALARNTKSISLRLGMRVMHRRWHI